MARYRERLYTDWKRTLVQLAFFLSIVVFSIFVIEPRRGVLWAVLFAAGGSWIMTGLFLRNNAYRCGKCKRVFRPPMSINFITPSAVGKSPDGTYHSYKTLTCPHCGTRGKSRVVTRGELKSRGDLLDGRRARRG